MPTYSQVILEAAQAAQVEPQEALEDLCTGFSVILSERFSDALACFGVDGDNHIGRAYHAELTTDDESETDSILVDLVVTNQADGAELLRLEVAEYPTALEAVQALQSPQFILALIHAFVDACGMQLEETEGE